MIGRLWRDWIAPRRGALLLAGGLSLVAAAAGTSYAFVIQWVFKQFEARDLSVVWIAPLLVLAATGVKTVATYLQGATASRLGLGVVADLQKTAFNHLLAADFERIQRDPPGQLLSRLTNDVTVIRDATVRAATNLMRDSLLVIGYVAAMFWFDWVLALAILVIYPFVAVPIRVIGLRMRKQAAAVQGQIGALTALLAESLGAARMVRAYRLERYERDRAAEAFDENFRLQMKLAQSRIRLDPILEFIGGFAVAAVIAIGGYRIASGAIDIGDFMGFITALLAAAGPARAIGTLTGPIQEATAAGVRLFAILDEPARIADAPDARALIVSGGMVRFDAVRFAYGNAGEDAVRNVSFCARRGETIAFVGPSGGGKSTILNLVPRLYDVTDGKVLIDSQDVRSVTRASLRDAVAIVSQDITLFNDTVRANIAFGRLDATQAEVEDAARAAAAHDFICTLPNGYDTIVGPGGGSLSGGERQRIALARAILKDAPILLLDEATSALDAESERKVHAALERLSAGRTTLVIAHRLSTVRKADCILVIEDGRVVEQGTHEQLLAKGGLYARLAAMQFAGA